MAGKASERFVWAVDTLEVRPADRLLEVGCGQGNELADRLREGGFCIDWVLVEDLRPVPAACAMGRPQGG